jgi:hypothetical protein
VFGPSFEGARINDNGQRALSWQTLGFGPFLLAGHFSLARDCGALPEMLERIVRSGKTAPAIF